MPDIMGEMDLSVKDKQLIEHLRSSWESQELEDAKICAHLQRKLGCHSRSAWIPPVTRIQRIFAEDYAAR